MVRLTFYIRLTAVKSERKLLVLSSGWVNAWKQRTVPTSTLFQWCRWELEVANHKLFEDDREFLVLVELERLDRRELPQHLSYLLDTRTYLEWPEGPGPHPGAWRRLKYALGESLYQKRARRQANQDDSKLARSCD